MEENENQNQNQEEVRQEASASAEEFKSETVDAVNQVKESMKNVNVKEDAKATQGFVTEMFKNPLGKIKEIANDNSNKYFKTAIILVIVWTVAVLLGSISFKYFTWKLFGKSILNYLKILVAPVLSVIVMSVIIFFMNKKSKKSLVTVLTTVTTANIPVIIASVINLLTLFSYNVSKITNKITSLCSIISVVFMFFAIRNLYGEKEEKTAFKNFVIIEAIYIVVAFIISYLGIGI